MSRYALELGMKGREEMSTNSIRVERLMWENRERMNQLFRWDERFPNFQPSELACKHCGLLMLNDEALTALQRLRTDWRAPIVISSGTRCKPYNTRVGGVENSLHLNGQAFDIPFPKGWSAVQVTSLIYHATRAGFRGFGLYDHFLHVDTGPHRTWMGTDPLL